MSDRERGLQRKGGKPRVPEKVHLDSGWHLREEGLREDSQRWANPQSLREASEDCARGQEFWEEKVCYLIKFLNYSFYLLSIT